MSSTSHHITCKGGPEPHIFHPYEGVDAKDFAPGNQTCPCHGPPTKDKPIHSAARRQKIYDHMKRRAEVEEKRAMEEAEAEKREEAEAEEREKRARHRKEAMKAAKKMQQALKLERQEAEEKDRIKRAEEEKEEKPKKKWWKRIFS